MKASKWIGGLLTVLFASVTFVGITERIAFELGQEHTFHVKPFGWFGADLNVRWNEIQCAHSGFNSFHIWNREIEVPGYCPMSRPDKQDCSLKPGDRIVHAYPAWHTAYFYFYGWIPNHVCKMVMASVFGACLVLICIYFRRVVSNFTTSPNLVMLAILSLVSYYVLGCFYWQNYGIFVLACLVGMCFFLERGCQMVAGVFWGVAMIKPQISVLVFWPLLFQRKYLTICVAIVTCLIGTCISSCIFHESPIDLILQIPQIGAPYSSGKKVQLLVKMGNYLQPTIFCAICAVAAYLMKNEKRWYCQLAPVVLCVPFWTYSNVNDHAILMFWFCVVASEICLAARWKYIWMGYAVFLVAAYLLKNTWSALLVWGAFSASGIGWIYRGTDLIWLGLSFGLMFAKILASRRKVDMA